MLAIDEFHPRDVLSAQEADDDRLHISSLLV
jgi:hypothetical protein